MAQLDSRLGAAGPSQHTHGLGRTVGLGEWGRGGPGCRGRGDLFAGGAGSFYWLDRGGLIWKQGKQENRAGQASGMSPLERTVCGEDDRGLGAGAGSLCREGLAGSVSMGQMGKCVGESAMGSLGCTVLPGGWAAL